MLWEDIQEFVVCEQVEIKIMTIEDKRIKKNTIKIAEYDNEISYNKLHKKIVVTHHVHCDV